MDQIIETHELQQKIKSEIEDEFDIIALGNHEAGLVRGLWKDVFPETSDSFLDFYFEHEAKDNTVFAVQKEELLSMLQLTPYVSAMRRNPPLPGANRLPCMADVVRVDAYLLSMAATREGYRNRGYMRRLIAGAIAYQRRIQIPFCIVNTDQGAFFEKFGFHYVSDNAQYRLNTDILSKEMLARAAEGETIQLASPNMTLVAADRGKLLMLAHFVNANLSRHYGLFHIRSAVYFERLQRELQSYGGNLYQIMENGKIKGYFAYTNDSREEIREVLFENACDVEKYFFVEKDKKPSVMARIVNLPEMLRHVSSNGKVTIAIRIKDPVIAENDGLFIWYLGAKGSYMERVEEPACADEPSVRPEVTTDIGKLTAFIFDYIKLKQNLKFDSIYLSGPVWMNERY